MLSHLCCRWTKRQRGREVTVSLAILNLTELNLYPRRCPWYSLFSVPKGDVNLPTNLVCGVISAMYTFVSETPYKTVISWQIATFCRDVLSLVRCFDSVDWIACKKSVLAVLRGNVWVQHLNTLFIIFANVAESQNVWAQALLRTMLTKLHRQNQCQTRSLHVAGQERCFAVRMCVYLFLCLFPALFLCFLLSLFLLWQ